LIIYLTVFCCLPRVCTPALIAHHPYWVLYRCTAVLVQLLPLSWLFFNLTRKYGVTFTDASTLRQVGKLFAPTGVLLHAYAAAAAEGQFPS
jgi:hypothetical protein